MNFKYHYTFIICGDKLVSCVTSDAPLELTHTGQSITAFDEDDYNARMARDVKFDRSIAVRMDNIHDDNAHIYPDANCHYPITYHAASDRGDDIGLVFRNTHCNSSTVNVAAFVYDDDNDHLPAEIICRKARLRTRSMRAL